MAPPLMPGQVVPLDWAEQQVTAGEIPREDFPDLSEASPPRYVGYLYSPTTTVRSPNDKGGNDPYNQLSIWNFKMGPYFELGTVYTLIAGLLNVLAIYDAWGGPVLVLGEPADESGEEKKKG